MPSRVRVLVLAALSLAATGCGWLPQEQDIDVDHETGRVETDADGDGHLAEEDCDDSDPAIHPGGTEFCNDIDDDCDGVIDEDADLSGSVWYVDGDGDGHGGSEEQITACEQPDGTTAEATDCNDDDPAVNPDATEVCDPDDVDENCSGRADNEDPDADPETMSTFHSDADGDGYAGTDGQGRAYGLFGADF